MAICARCNAVHTDISLLGTGAEERAAAYKQINVVDPNATEAMTLEQLDMPFVFLPSSKIYGFREHELKSVALVCVE